MQKNKRLTVDHRLLTSFNFFFHFSYFLKLNKCMTNCSLSLILYVFFSSKSGQSMHHRIMYAHETIVSLQIICANTFSTETTCTSYTQKLHSTNLTIFTYSSSHRGVTLIQHTIHYVYVRVMCQCFRLDKDARKGENPMFVCFHFQ